MSLKVVLPFAIDLIVSNLDICWLQFQNTHKAGSVLFKCNWATHIVFHLAWFFQSEDSFSKNICSPVLAKASVSFGLGRVLDVGVIEQVLRRYVKTGSREVHHKNRCEVQDLCLEPGCQGESAWQWWQGASPSPRPELRDTPGGKH